MENQELNDLFDSIKLKVKDDQEAEDRVTTYLLPEEAHNAEVVDVISKHFEHYENVEVDEGYNLVLNHPEKDD
ncbi:hypothetical protein [Vibrio caribbeanicus]|uniref:hypothetical protein n=1 Tax=Vibrio caribbeanicus TaxID=701175 RepID=UPI0022839841|nr:hypothetical protein [Vibrio caribbeanicus]MCY9844543.1 hypothetical protein [Vibrio caribbeanicus]